MLDDGSLPKNPSTIEYEYNEAFSSMSRTKILPKDFGDEEECPVVKVRAAKAMDGLGIF
jgi:hypothetical protein